MSEAETTETPAERTRQVKNSALKTYLWERVPRQLLEDATAKAKAMEPPLSLKALLIKLLREWTYGEVKCHSRRGVEVSTEAEVRTCEAAPEEKTAN